jgi:hypothetical protein
MATAGLDQAGLTFVDTPRRLLSKAPLYPQSRVKPICDDSHRLIAFPVFMARYAGFGTNVRLCPTYAEDTQAG